MDSGSASPSSLYRTILGDAYDSLDPAVRRFHALRGQVVLHGRVTTRGPASAPGRLLARLLGTPLDDSEGPIRFTLDAQPAEETWTREFPARTMRSRLRLAEGGIAESLGAARLSFGLSATDGRLDMHLRSLRFLGIPTPRWLMPRVLARETGAASRLCFEIEASVPWIGRVSGYRGWLDLDTAIPDDASQDSLQESTR